MTSYAANQIVSLNWHMAIWMSVVGVCFTAQTSVAVSRLHIMERLKTRTHTQTKPSIWADKKNSLHLGMGMCFKLIIGMGCTAIFVAFPPTIMDSTTGEQGRLHNGGWKGGKDSHTTHPQ